MKHNFFMRMNLLNTDVPQGTPGTPPPAAPPTGTPPTGTPPPSSAPEWLKGVEDEFVNDPIMKNVQDIPSLVKSYVHAQRQMGKKGFVLPDKNAPIEKYKELYTAMGGPSLEEYKYDLPEKHGLDDNFIKNFNKIAHDNNILPSQAKAMMEYYRAEVEKEDKDYLEQRAQAQTNAEKLLKTEWGDGFEKNLFKAQQVVKTFGDESITKFLDESGLGNEPSVIKFLAKIGESLNEDTFKSDAVGHLGMTKDEAQAELNQTMADFNGAYYNSAHADHARMVQRVNKLHSVLAS